MQRSPARFGLLATVLLAPSAATAAATELPTAERTPLKVPRVEGPVAIDGVLDDAAWTEALVIPVDVEVQPGENVPPPVRTHVYLAYGSGRLYVAFDARDPEPARIRARYSDRDQVGDDDWVGIVLDTFDDQRRSFDFLCNPLGVQSDMIETSQNSDDSWDAIWDSAGRIGSQGYVVEMAIPFSSLRFRGNSGGEVWGFDAIRSYPRGVRHHIGSFPRDRGNNCYLCQALKIEGFAGADPGRNLEFDPTVAATYAERRDAYPDGRFVKRDSSVEPGLTARWSVTPNLTLNGTVNPDFSQVEADAAQLDVNTRFALFYPEKRPFFTEGMDFFNNPMNVVYTRTLADPDWGAKLSGKVGRGALGLFTVRDAVTNLLLSGSQGSAATVLGESTQGTALRYRRDVGGSSTVGVLATGREGGEYHNRVLGADAVLRFTKTDTLYVEGFASSTRYPRSIADGFGQPAGELRGAALDLLFSHATRLWEHYLHYQDYGEDFRADLGFVPQVGFRFLDTGSMKRWYNDDPGHWYNQIRTWIGYERTEDASGRTLRNVGGTFVLYSGPKESSIYALLYLGRQSFRNVDFDHDTLSVEASFRPVGDLTVGGTLFWGDAVDVAGVRPAKRLRVAPSIQLFAGRRLRLNLDHTWERLRVDAGELYVANLSELRAVWYPGRRTFLRAILQRSDVRFDETIAAGPVPPRSRTLLSQLLLGYKVDPQTAIYVGYSDDYVGDAATPLTQVDRALFFKIGYAWVL